MKHIIRLSRWMVMFVAFLLSQSIDVRACGIDWSVPRNHFNGVDEFGHVSIVDSLGTLDLGDGLRFPIYMIFNSGWQSSSPYLGQGWMVPLLESKIVQIDDNTFQLWQPDGRYQFMGRDKETNTILHGQAGWAAEINGDTITAWVECGWRLIYHQGKLTSMITPANRKLDLVHEDGQVIAIQEKGMTVLKVETDTQNGMVKGLTFNDKTVGIEQGSKPIIEQLTGKNVISGMAKSLSKLTLPNGTNKNYDFKINDNLEPSLKIDSQRCLTWDPVTGQIKTDGDWVYQIGQRSGSETGISITRINGMGKKEGFRQDELSESAINISGTGYSYFKTWFASGLLGNKVRELKQTLLNGGILDAKYVYDENGHLLRVNILYDNKLVQELTEIKAIGEITSFKTKAGNTYTIDSNKNITSIAFSNSPYIIKYVYGDDNRLTGIFLNNKTIATYTYSGVHSTKKILGNDITFTYKYADNMINSTVSRDDKQIYSFKVTDSPIITSYSINGQPVDPLVLPFINKYASPTAGPLYARVNLGCAEYDMGILGGVSMLQSKSFVIPNVTNDCAVAIVNNDKVYYYINDPAGLNVALSDQEGQLVDEYKISSDGFIQNLHPVNAFATPILLNNNFIFNKDGMPLFKSLITKSDLDFDKAVKLVNF